MTDLKFASFDQVTLVSKLLPWLKIVQWLKWQSLWKRLKIASQELRDSLTNVQSFIHQVSKLSTASTSF